MKTKEELNALKKEVEALNKKLAELTEEELAQVTGGDVSSANIVGYTNNSVGTMNNYSFIGADFGTCSNNKGAQ